MELSLYHATSVIMTANLKRPGICNEHSLHFTIYSVFCLMVSNSVMNERDVPVGEIAVARWCEYRKN